jgi:uncharacterized protein (DUF1800 family)
MASGVVSDRERSSHVIRRLSMGAHSEVVAHVDGTDAAIARAFDLETPAAPPFDYPAPSTYVKGDLGAITGPISWWFTRMASGDRMIEERLVWFWHDHFATSLAKVLAPYLMWTQHLTIRRYATGNFAELLKAVARDPAMVVYLDGIRSTASDRNENFGRECLELFTMGRDGGYTQDDVVAASRAFTGWVVDIPGRVGDALGQPWQSVLVARRHDAGVKTLLGKTGTFDMDGALDVVLGHPATAAFITRKLYRELVGLEPSASTVDRLAKRFRADYEILPLARAIASERAFVSDDAVRSKFRTPVEKVVAIMQATGTTTLDLGRGRIGPKQTGRGLTGALRTLSYLPFLPPNVGGFPKGARLVGPGNLVHTFDLLQAVATLPTARRSVDEQFARLGVFDLSDDTRAVVGRHRDPATRFALAVTAPEFTLT